MPSEPVERAEPPGDDRTAPAAGGARGGDGRHRPVPPDATSGGRPDASPMPPQVDPATGDGPGEVSARYRAGTDHLSVDPVGASGVHTPQAAEVHEEHDAEVDVARPAASPEGMQRPTPDDADARAGDPAGSGRRRRSG